MGIQINYNGPAVTLPIWDSEDLAALEPTPSFQPDMVGKVVFFTVQGMCAAHDLVAEYARTGAHVAVLDLEEWSLHLTQSCAITSDRAPSDEPIHCPSWVAAVEEVIARFGPIHLWFDTREMTWPAVSRSDASR